MSLVMLGISELGRQDTLGLGCWLLLSVTLVKSWFGREGMAARVSCGWSCRVTVD